jgi:GTP-binding protein EngB required for normal cell division
MALSWLFNCRKRTSCPSADAIISTNDDEQDPNCPLDVPHVKRRHRGKHGILDNQLHLPELKHLLDLLGNVHDSIRILALGSQNVGKSSTLNRLLGKRLLDVGEGLVTSQPLEITFSDVDADGSIHSNEEETMSPAHQTTNVHTEDDMLHTIKIVDFPGVKRSNSTDEQWRYFYFSGKQLIILTLSALHDSPSDDIALHLALEYDNIANVLIVVTKMDEVVVDKRMTRMAEFLEKPFCSAFGVIFVANSQNASNMETEDLRESLFFRDLKEQLNKSELSDVSKVGFGIEALVKAVQRMILSRLRNTVVPAKLRSLEKEMALVTANIQAFPDTPSGLEIPATFVRYLSVEKNDIDIPVPTVVTHEKEYVENVVSALERLFERKERLFKAKTTQFPNLKDLLLHHVHRAKAGIYKQIRTGENVTKLLGFSSNSKKIVHTELIEYIWSLMVGCVSSKSLLLVTDRYCASTSLFAEDAEIRDTRRAMKDELKKLTMLRADLLEALKTSS